MPRVIEINEVDQLDDIRLTWNCLLPKTRGLSFFHTLDWLKTYWRFFGHNQRLRVLVAMSGSNPVGILPLTVRCEATKVGQVRVLTYPLHDWGTFFGPVGPNPTATLSLAMQHLRDAPRDWDLLDLRWVNRDEHDHLRTQWAMQHAGFAVASQAWQTTNIVDLGQGWEHYWSSRSSKFRHNVKRNERRLEQHGAIQLVRHRPLSVTHGDGDPNWDLYNTCVDIAARSWQGSSTDGTTLSTESVRHFFREAHQQAAKNGMVDMCVLEAGGHPVAFSYNYHCQGQLIGMRIGFDPDYRKYGPGNAMYVQLFHDSARRGDVQFDLGIGSSEIKKNWTTRRVDSYRYTHYAPVAKAQLLRLKHWHNRRKQRKVV
jgi:CelD/BcsL family acetyltransferase involved in cellulose biosynthesis